MLADPLPTCPVTLTDLWASAPQRSWPSCCLRRSAAPRSWSECNLRLDEITRRLCLIEVTQQLYDLCAHFFRRRLQMHSGLMIVADCSDGRGIKRISSWT